MLDNKYVDKESSLKWLWGGLLSITERTVFGAQDQELTTRATLHLYNKTTEPTCRFRKQNKIHLPISLAETFF